MYDAIIVGGGASGLVAACALARPNRRVVLLEKQSRVGRKLLSTGNGRCNLTNLRAAPKHYHGTRAAAKRALELCPPEDVCAFFDVLGLPTTSDEAGRVYPMSNQAASVLDVLRLSAAERGCEMRVECAAENIQMERNGLAVRLTDGELLRAKVVLVCTGGLAAPKLGACGDGYRMLEALGHSSTPKFSAIAALKTPPDVVRALKGQRAECEIALLVGGREIRIEHGEILFSETGVSGIAAMQLARTCNEALRAHRECALRIDFIPKVSDGIAFVRERIQRIPERSAEDFLNGIVSKRIGQTLIKAAGINMDTRAREIDNRQSANLGTLLTGWTIPVTGVLGFEQAQVTAGGISLKDFNWETFESKRVPGLYVAGELLDVDGDCGGFNLQWAWSTALIAARAIVASWKYEC